MDCAAPRHHLEPAEAEPHAMLCKPCRIRLASDLARLPLLHAALADVLGHGGSKSPGRGRGDGLPFNDRVSECRSQIVHDLSWWARHAAADRRAIADTSSVPVMAGFLRGALSWCRFRDWAGDMAGAVSGDAREAKALLDPWVTRRFEVRGHDGACVECAAGRLWVTVYASDGDKRRSHAECDGCAMVWLPEQWMRLGTRIIQRREALAA